MGRGPRARRCGHGRVGRRGISAWRGVERGRSASPRPERVPEPHRPSTFGDRPRRCGRAPLLELCRRGAAASRGKAGGPFRRGAGEDHAGDDDDHDGARRQDQREHVHSGRTAGAGARCADDHNDHGGPVPARVCLERLRGEGQYGPEQLLARTTGPDHARVREHRTGLHRQRDGVCLSARQHRVWVRIVGVVERGAGLDGMPVDLHGSDRAGSELVTEFFVLMGAGVLHAGAGGLSRPAGSARSVSSRRDERGREQPDSGGRAGGDQPHRGDLVTRGGPAGPGEARRDGSGWSGRWPTGRGRSPDLSRPPATLS